MNERIYVDHSATTPIREEVLEKMLPILKEDFGNPSSLHLDGRKAKKLLTEARGNISEILSASLEEVVFTSGGTESNNLVISGIKELVEKKILKKKKHIVTSRIEHSATKSPLEKLEEEGWKITWLNVNKEGFIDLDELKDSITNDTALVTIIHGNNEIGTIQDLSLISNFCNKKDVLFHTDTIQTFGKIPIDTSELNINFLSFSSHKIYGPKGVGGLYINSNNTIQLPSMQYGGNQEYGIRPGTENMSGVIGFGEAARLAKDEMMTNSLRLLDLQFKLTNELEKIDGVVLTGPEPSILNPNSSLLNPQSLSRIPGHVSLCAKNIEGESLVMQLDLKGISASSGSACTTSGNKAMLKPSHVIEAIGIPDEYKKGSLRITLGRANTEEDIEKISESLKEILSQLTTMASH